MSKWTNAELAEVCSLITDGTHHSPSNHRKGAFKYVTAKNIRPWGLDLSDITYVDTTTHQGIYARCPVEYDDVLYIKDGVTTGIAALNTLNEPFSMLSSVALLKPNRAILEPRYLKHWLNSPLAYQAMTGEMTGTAIKRLVLKQIRATAIQVAPLPEQKRIADKLDTVLARVDACRDRLDRLPALLKRFRQSILAAATSGRLTEDWRNSNELSAEWKDVRLSEIADIQGGVTKDSKKQSLNDEEVPYLRVANVQRGYIDLTEMKSIRVPARKLEGLLLEPGDILFNEGGDLDKLGRGWIWEGQIKRCSFQNHVFRARLLEPANQPKYISWWGNSRGLDYFISCGKQTTNLASINKTMLSNLPISLPHPLEQTEIVRRVEILFAFADRLEARLATARKQVEQLTPALLAKAFRGELVPQDPADEPASELLKRLAAQRAAAPKAGRGSKAAKV